jgi:hypothetical protein
MSLGHELPPSLLGELVDGSYDNVLDAERAVVLKPGMDPGDPGSLGLGPVSSTVVVFAPDPPLDPATGTIYIDASRRRLNPDGSRP